jgi:hypothetical protein
MAYVMWNTKITLESPGWITVNNERIIAHRFMASEVREVRYVAHVRGLIVKKYFKPNALLITYVKSGEDKKRELVLFSSAYKKSELERIKAFIGERSKNIGV